VRKISPTTGVRSPDRTIRSESLYRLSYPGPLYSLDTDGIAGRGVKLTTHLYLVLRLRICGVLPPQFLNAFVKWTAVTLPLTAHKGSERRDCSTSRSFDITSIGSFLLCTREIVSVKIPVRTPSVMTLGFHGLYRLLHANTKTISEIRPRPLPFLSIRIYFVLIFLSFNT
jgi:hypothetical protein